MLCRDAMTEKVESLRVNHTVQDAARRMREAKVGFLPICDDSGRVVGTVTDRDLTVRALAEGRDATTRVGDLMSRDIVACRPSDDIRIAQDLMARRHKARIVCTEADGRLVGVLGLSDLIMSGDVASAIRTFREISSPGGARPS